MKICLARSFIFLVTGTYGANRWKSGVSYYYQVRREHRWGTNCTLFFLSIFNHFSNLSFQFVFVVDLQLFNYILYICLMFPFSLLILLSVQFDTLTFCYFVLHLSRDQITFANFLSAGNYVLASRKGKSLVILIKCELWDKFQDNKHSNSRID